MTLQGNERYNKFSYYQGEIDNSFPFTSSSEDSVNTVMLYPLSTAVYICCASAKSQNIQIKGSFMHVNTCVKEKNQPIKRKSLFFRMVWF